MRRRRTGAALLAAALVAVFGLLLHVAVLDGVERFPFTAAIGAARSSLTAAAIVVAVGGAIAALIARHPRLLVLPVALLAVAGVSGATLAGRGYANEPPAAGGLRVLSWNTNGGLVNPAVAAALAVRTKADIVVLPQIGADANGAAFRAAMTGVGLAPVPGADPQDQTLLFTAPRLGTYATAAVQRPEPLASAVARPADPASPTIIGVHLAKPVFSASVQAADLEWIAGRCSAPDTIVVGDFNATVDTFGGPAVGACRDAASERDAASTGTWPTLLPPPLAMPIDHVLVGDAWQVRSFTVLTDEDGSGARHRPVFAVLDRRS